jgi:hypothetical protein
MYMYSTLLDAQKFSRQQASIKQFLFLAKLATSLVSLRLMTKQFQNIRDSGYVHFQRSQYLAPILQVLLALQRRRCCLKQTQPLLDDCRTICWFIKNGLQKVLEDSTAQTERPRSGPVSHNRDFACPKMRAQCRLESSLNRLLKVLDEGKISRKQASLEHLVMLAEACDEAVSDYPETLNSTLFQRLDAPKILPQSLTLCWRCW